MGHGAFTTFHVFSKNHVFPRGPAVLSLRRKRRSLVNSHQRSWWISLDLVPRDLDAAKQWLERAANDGNIDAQKRLATWDQEMQHINRYAATAMLMGIVGLVIVTNLVLNIILVFRCLVPKIGCLFSAIALAFVVSTGLALLMSLCIREIVDSPKMLFAAAIFQIPLAIALLVFSYAVSKLRFQALPDEYRLNPDVVQRNVERM